jgi:hypothetical protein
MKNVYRALAGLISLGVLVQAMAIALGWFTAIKDLDDGLVIDKNYEGNFGHGLHGFVGMTVIPVIALLLLIVSFFAKIAGGIKWALFVVGLVTLQILLAFVSFGVPAVGALHGANALALLAVAGIAARRVATEQTAPAGTEETTTV